MNAIDKAIEIIQNCINRYNMDIAFFYGLDCQEICYIKEQELNKIYTENFKK